MLKRNITNSEPPAKRIKIAITPEEQLINILKSTAPLDNLGLFTLKETVLACDLSKIDPSLLIEINGEKHPFKDVLMSHVILFTEGVLKEDFFNLFPDNYDWNRRLVQLSSLSRDLYKMPLYLYRIMLNETWFYEKFKDSNIDLELDVYVSENARPKKHFFMLLIEMQKYKLLDFIIIKKNYDFQLTVELNLAFQKLAAEQPQYLIKLIQKYKMRALVNQKNVDPLSTSLRNLIYPHYLNLALQRDKKTNLNTTLSWEILNLIEGRKVLLFLLQHDNSIVELINWNRIDIPQNINTINIEPGISTLGLLISNMDYTNQGACSELILLIELIEKNFPQLMINAGNLDKDKVSILANLVDACIKYNLTINYYVLSFFLKKTNLWKINLDEMLPSFPLLTIEKSITKLNSPVCKTILEFISLNKQADLITDMETIKQFIEFKLFPLTQAIVEKYQCNAICSVLFYRQLSRVLKNDLDFVWHYIKKKPPQSNDHPRRIMSFFFYALSINRINIALEILNMNKKLFCVADRNKMFTELKFAKISNEVKEIKEEISSVKNILYNFDKQEIINSKHKKEIDRLDNQCSSMIDYFHSHNIPLLAQIKEENSGADSLSAIQYKNIFLPQVLAASESTTDKINFIDLCDEESNELLFSQGLDGNLNDNDVMELRQNDKTPRLS